jgi:peptidoglycan/LPS O-acetylase OafA/YrhL
MAVWIWVLACALSFALAAPFVFRAGRFGTPRTVLARIFLVLGYLVLAVLLLADIFVQDWSDPALRFTRGCVAGLGAGAILGALGLVARRAPGCQSR